MSKNNKCAYDTSESASTTKQTNENKPPENLSSRWVFSLKKQNKKWVLSWSYHFSESMMTPPSHIKRNRKHPLLVEMEREHNREVYKQFPALL